MADAKLKAKFVKSWIQYRIAKAEMETLKAKVLPMFHESEIVAGCIVTPSERYNFSEVTLEEARKYKAVKKAVNTTKLLFALYGGAKIDGVTTTKYLTVTPTAATA